MKFAGIGLVVFASFIPLLWFMPLMASNDAVALFSQYIGCVALILMGISQLLACRFRWLELIFGGLDRIYQLHKWLGITAMAAILIHDTIDAEIDGLGRETFLVDLAETLGELSLYSLLILVVISVTTFIPYQMWRWTHKFMGALFALSAFHFVFILKPFSIWDPLGLYVNAFCLLGILCYLYTLLPFGALQGRFTYRVETVERSGDAISVSLTPQKKGLSHRAGQFAFIQFDLDGWTEIHPFTISKAPDADKSLRFSIKPLGDDTYRLSNKLVEGAEARMSPAYGHFTRSNTKKPEIWVAGGIGVTPFAAFAGSLNANHSPIHFFYCVRNRDQAAHLEEFEALAARDENFHLHLIETSMRARLGMSVIESAIEGPVNKYVAYYCGPKALRETLKAGFQAKGVPSRQFKFEEFEIRSGIGIGKPLKQALASLIAFVQKKQIERQAH